MNAKELKYFLQSMPDDANVKYIWDGEARSSVSHVWLSNGGDVILCDVRDGVYDAENLPLGVTKDDGALYWESPNFPMEMPIKKTRKDYCNQHICCPSCGSTRILRTLASYAFDRAAPDAYMDKNRANCECGWTGVVHDMVPPKLNQS